MKQLRENDSCGQLTIWLTINDCLSVTIDGSKRTNDNTSLLSQKQPGLTDKRPITSRLNWPITSITIEFNTINWRETTHFDSEDDYRTGCRNLSHYQQQQSYSGLRSPGRSYSTYLWNDSWVQTFHICLSNVDTRCWSQKSRVVAKTSSRRVYAVSRRGIETAHLPLP